MSKRYWNVLLLAACLAPAVLMAQDDKDLPPVSRTYAITNATVVQAPGRKIDKATVLIKNGLITAVGSNLTVPPDAILVKGDSLYVYAGFIDGLSHVGVTKPKEENTRERVKDPGNPTPERAGITPQQDVRYLLNPADKAIEDFRAIGFTVAQVVPYGVFFPGNGAVILLNSGPADQSVLVSQSALYSELTPPQNVYPATLIGVMSKWRELYKQAALSHAYEQVYASNRSGLERPVTDRVLQAFYPVIDRKQPVIFKSDQALDVHRILAMQSELQFPVIIGDVKSGTPALNKIKTANARVFLSLDLPEEKKKEEKKEGKTADAEQEHLDKRQAEAIALRAAQAADFQKAGVAFGFSALSVKSKDVMANLRRMIAAGLTEDQALAALTTSPAQLLGLSDRMGSVDNGKMANLVVTTKPLFNEKAKVKHVWVDGKLFTYDVKDAPKKSDGAAKVEIQGTWSFSVETPQGKLENKVTFKKDGASYSGTVSGGILPEPADISEIEVNGTNLRFTYQVSIDGNKVTVQVDGTLEGDSFTGTSTAGSFGSFSTGATRDPKF